MNTDALDVVDGPSLNADDDEVTDQSREQLCSVHDSGRGLHVVIQFEVCLVMM